MPFPTPSAQAAIAECLSNKHFAWVRAHEMQPMLAEALGTGDWDSFATSWDDLPEDLFMADGGRYRRRRHAAFSVRRGAAIERKPPQPHYQSRDRNPLNGGIERWFDPVPPEVADGPTMGSIFELCRQLLSHLRPEVNAWHTEVHQFRILTRAEEVGLPTPEGMHRDGVDFVCVLLVKRQNVRSGTTTIADLERVVQGEFTLTDPLDAAFVDDRFAFHGVTAIQPEDPLQPAFRDVLVVTWKAQ